MLKVVSKILVNEKKQQIFVYNKKYVSIDFIISFL